MLLRHLLMPEPSTSSKPRFHLCPRLLSRSSTLILWTLEDSNPLGMRTELTLLLLILLTYHGVLCCSVCQGQALKCHTCVASNEDDCNQQGSAPCPQYADACSTITGPNTVMKSCTYKDFCNKAHSSSSGAKMQCCFSDNCNGPHGSQSHRDSHHSGAGAAASSPVLLLGAAVLRLALRQL